MLKPAKIETRAGPFILRAINEGDRGILTELLGQAFRGSPWLVARAERSRPFATRDALIAALVENILGAGRAERIALIRAHPELTDELRRAARSASLSRREPVFLRPEPFDNAEFGRLEDLTAAYRKRFGFPFVIAAPDHDKASILACLEARLGNEEEEEIDQAARSVARIVALRIQDLVPE